MIPTTTAILGFTEKSITDAIIKNRQAYVQCNLTITDLHTARKSLGKALAQPIIRNNLKLRNEVKSVIASVDSVISQTACEKGVHSSEISELTHILNTLQVA